VFFAIFETSLLPLEVILFTTPLLSCATLDIIRLEPDNVFFYSQDADFKEYSKRFFNVLINGERILIHPSIFVFHPLNSIYFLFYEDVENVEPISPRSILKKSSVVSDSGEHTKKKRVTIKLKPKNSKTRKSKKQIAQIWDYENRCKHCLALHLKSQNKKERIKC
jgi:hypothetical protein